MTTKHSAADTDASDKPSFIPNTDLPELDPHPERRDEIPHELAEIDPTVSREKEEELVLFWKNMSAQDFHFQPMGIDLSTTRHERARLQLFRLIVVCEIVLTCDS